MRAFDGLWNAVGFLTRLPVPSKVAMEAWRESPPWYPVVGLLLGGLLAASAWLLQFIAPPWVLAMGIVTLWVFLTGGLHLDGLMDTGDGFGSHRSRERILEIMKDSRVGAMGVLTALLVLGNKVAALASLTGAEQLAGLVLAPVIGRGAMLAALTFAPYAREDGLGHGLRGATAWSWAFTGLVIAGGIFILQEALLAALLLAALTAWLLIRTSCRKIGGCTGDVYGAICEAAETAVLLGLATGGGFL